MKIEKVGITLNLTARELRSLYMQCEKDKDFLDDAGEFGKDILNFIKNVEAFLPEITYTSDCTSDFGMKRQLNLESEEKEMEKVRLLPVESSSVKAVGYNNGILLIQFKNGATYAYENVMPFTFIELINAESIGRFVADFTKTNKGKKI